MKKRTILAVSLVAGLFMTFATAPIIGEMVATAPPLFSKRDKLSILEAGLPYEEVSFPTSNGLMLRGWFIPADEENSPAVIYAPATAHDLRQGVSLVRPLHEAGFHVLLFSYRGSGESQGDRLDFSYGYRESLDLDAAVDYLYTTREIPKIGAIGHSAGAVTTILSAARNPRIAAVVAAAPYSTLEEIWLENRPALFPQPLYRQSMQLFEKRKGFSKELVRPLDVIEKIAPRPIMLVFGREDLRISQVQAKQLIHAARLPYQVIWLEGASHSQVRSPGLDNLAGRIAEFFKENLRSTQS